MTDATIKFNPTTGVYFRLNQDVAGVGGSTRYLRDELHASYYYPVAPKWTFSLSEGPAATSLGLARMSKSEDRFFLGGTTFRGFENYGVGPHDTSTGDHLAAMRIILLRLN